MQITYKETAAFQKDLKRLTKRFITLPADLDVAKKAAIELYHVLNLDNRAVFEIPGYGTGDIRFYKIKRFACRSLKNRGNQSGIRVIYAFNKNTGIVAFIEIYFKGDQEDLTKSRLTEYRI
jgi:mRNA-degrading endonuclease RelE of RelBE toxin-antitoxin system